MRECGAQGLRLAWPAERPAHAAEQGEEQRARRARLRVREGLEQELTPNVRRVAREDVPEIVRLPHAEHHVRRPSVADVRQPGERVGRDPVVVEEADVLAAERPVGEPVEGVEVDVLAIDARLVLEERTPRGVFVEAVHRARHRREVHGLGKDEHLIEAPRIAGERAERAGDGARAMPERKDANGRGGGLVGGRSVHQRLLIVTVDNRAATVVVKGANGV